MKPLVTAIGIAALLLVSAGAYAQPYPFTWDGGYYPSGNYWSAPYNWNRNSSWPGGSQNYDTATISDGTPYSTVNVNGTVQYDVASVVVNADTENVSLMLQINSSGVLSVEDGSNTGYIQLTADEDSGAYHATLQYNAGSVDWDRLLCYGNNVSTSYGYAVVDINASLNVTSGGAEADVYMEEYCSVDVARGATWTVNDVVIGNMSGNNAIAQLSATGDDGTGSMSCSSITIDGGSGSDTTVTVTSNASMATRT